MHRSSRFPAPLTRYERRGGDDFACQSRLPPLSTPLLDLVSTHAASQGALSSVPGG